MTSSPTLKRAQRTLKKDIAFSGIGLHTGVQVSMRLLPAPPGTGLVFRRTDLAGHPTVPAQLAYVQETVRCTTLGHAGVSIHTVEHVLAAVRAYQIDNLYIELSALEPPIADGSALPFVEMIEQVGVCEQEGKVSVVSLRHPIYWSEGEMHLVALPSDHYRVSYTLSYPNTPLLRGQYYSLHVTAENFKREVAACRTFCLQHEIDALMARGLVKGGSLDNAVVIGKEGVLNEEGLRFPDEMARHKVLDLVGDLALTGCEFLAHIIAIRSGHQANYAFAHRLSTHLQGG